MTAFYNEIDPIAAEWLRNLIAAGHIAPGVVDERDIRDISPNELMGFTQCHFFAGIGIWSLALRRAGWSDDTPIWTGSCPCQPFSAAGKRGGEDDERHLWPAFFHLVDQRRPAILLGEQVASKDGLGWLDLVSADLEGTDYAFGASDLCAAGFGGAHIRQRLYFVGLGDTNGARTAPRLPEPAQREEGHAEVDDHGSHRLPGRGAGRPDVVGLANAQGIDGGPGLRDPRASGDGLGRHFASDGGTVCGVAPAHSRQRDGIASGEGCERDGSPTGWVEGDCGAQPGGAVGGLADRATSGRREECSDAGRLARGDSTQGVGAGLGAGGGDKRPHAPMLGRNPADWLYCRDGKWRPVEPGTFPLAHAAPGRVGRLRAYGNGLDAETAKGFVVAIMSVMATDSIGAAA